MFNFFKNRTNLLINEKVHFINLLNELIKILSFENNKSQIVYLQELVELLNENLFDKFITLFKHNLFWGGAGSVWEVGFISTEKELEFYNCMLQLIDLAKKTGISNCNIRRIKSIYKNELSTRQKFKYIDF